MALECFVKKGGKYLMLRRSESKKILPGVLLAPGGKREFNEGLFECARREILEETGLEIKNIKIKVAGNGYLKDVDQEVFFHFLVADYASGELHQDPDDGELLWMTEDEIVADKDVLAEIPHVAKYIFDDLDKCVSYTVVYERGNEMSELVMEE